MALLIKNGEIVTVGARERADIRNDFKRIQIDSNNRIDGV